jgi:hypothetical protein
MRISLNESRYLLLIPILLLCWLSLTALQWGLADLRIRFARDTLDNWSQKTTAPTKEDWNRVEKTLLKAQGLTASNHPDVKELLGRAYIVRSGIVLADAHESLTSALQYYQQAAVLRPVSPYPWAAIIIIQHALGRYDDSFDEALSKATYYGQWNPDILLMITEVAFASQTMELSTRTRTLLDDNVIRAVKVQREKVTKLKQKMKT